MSSTVDEMRVQSFYQKHYNQLFAQISEAMLVFEPYHNQIIDANQSVCRLLGYAKQELLTLKVSHLHIHEVPALVVFTQSVLYQGHGWTKELSCRRKNGTTIAVEYSATRLKADGKEFIAVVLRDRAQLKRLHETAEANDYVRQGISEWKKIEKIFHEIEKENQLILSAAGEGIYGVNADGKTTFVNPAAERILGWKAEELVGREIHSIMHHSKADGSIYPVRECPIYAAFCDGVVHQVDNEVFWRQDGTPIAVEYTSTPIEDNGRLVGAVVVFRDVSDRKEAEANLRAALAEVERLKKRLEMENAYLLEEINAEYNYKEIIGKSVAVQKVIQQIELVAPTDANVLITGETGTGKELIARAIHEASLRRDRPLIRVNCAAIPRGLFESEFFGHVKGAFTGAVSDRTGRFELADGGTLFLDEVGEIPLELQSKLLRVLQEGQFEKVGDTKTRKVNVRVIAATNRELKIEARQQRFREDLYFRLNVFPIESAPLRERIMDVPLLASHFLNRATKKFSKSNLRFTQGDIARLQAYHWPGNIRELENVIERAVIVSQHGRLRFDFPDTEVEAAIVASDRSAASVQAEVLTDKERRRRDRENIIAALKASKGKVFGPGGAAELLSVKPTTLASRMKRLGIGNPGKSR